MSNVDIDVALAEVWERINASLLEVDRLFNWVRAAGGSSSMTTRTMQRDSTGRAHRERANAEYASQLALTDELRTETAPFDAEFARRGGWTRTFTTTDGADTCAHSTLRCPDRGTTTIYTWYPEFAGQPTAAVAATLGVPTCPYCVAPAGLA